jgi:hypothetical protein
MTDASRALAPPSCLISSPEETYELRPLVAHAATGACTVGILALACAYAGWFGTIKKDLSDFNAFVIAGQMAWDGAITDAYNWRSMMAAQKAFTGGDAFMPWGYPPPYNVVAAALAAVPQWAGYLLLVGAPYAILCVVLARMAPACAPAALIVLFPSAVLTLSTGQNGFLTGALMAGVCALALRQSAMAGVLLGVMVIKPHLALGLGLFFLIRGSVRVLAPAFVAAGVLCLAATLAFGTKIWPAFLVGAGEAGAFLRAGMFQLDKMPTVYASARTLGLGLAPSLAAHAALAALAVAAIVAGAIWIRDLRLGLGVACLCSLFISPYLYQYDLALLAVAAALLLPAILAHTGATGLTVTIGSTWIASGSWYWSLLRAGEPGRHRDMESIPQAVTDGLAAVSVEAPVSAGAFGLLVFAGLVAVTVWRDCRSHAAG